MSLDVRVKDGLGNNEFAKVTDNSELLVIQAMHPPFEAQKVRPFRQYFTINGLPDGDNDMGVDGSVSPVDFCIPATNTYDRYITAISILIGYGASSQPFKFADGVALANGCRLYYESERGEVDIHDALKSNQDVLRLSDDAITAFWELRGVNALNDYGYIVSVDFTVLSSQYGIKIDEGTNQKMVLSVRDDATAADSFNIIAYGFERFK